MKIKLKSSEDECWENTTGTENNRIPVKKKRVNIFFIAFSLGR
jgi:hypothetical protein